MEKYETVWQRFGAGILDSIILLPISWGITFFILFVSPRLLENTFSSIAVSFVSVGYYILMHSRYGQTLGKMVTKVKVLDNAETPINFGQAVLRSLPQLLPLMFAISFSTADDSIDSISQSGLMIIYISLVVFYLADIVVCLVNEKRRALHDFIAGTVVVKTNL
jgi:uncharacterized RDD family membrane protein YckC